MKIVNQAFKHLILVGLIVSTSLSESFGQVITRVLSPEDKIENYIPWYNPDEEIPIVNAPFVDVEAVLQEDEQEGRLLPRISINQETNISSDEWLVIQRGNFSIWNIALAGENAKSMSVRFENTHLPENAMMFIYNRESRFIVGPISSDNFINGSFRSDYVGGSMAEVSIFVPGHAEPNITISSYDYGIVSSTSFAGTFGVSDDCNINVACEEGNGWECQINSVCRIFTDGGSNCSGTIVNNDCCDLTSFILTADHCVDGVLDDYLFIFNWQTPECENGEFAPTQWITYQGARVIANWGDTDFSLLELIQDIRPEDRISFSGWDRRNAIPDEVTLIHHPRGDVKKISFDENPQIEDEEIDYGPFVIPADHSYFSIFNEIGTTDFGIFEGGSSGCGWFNQEQRIVSTQIGGRRPFSCDNEELWGTGGRLNLSWEGNGTPDSRLRDWLGASTNPNTMDCMEHPFTEGPDVLCEEPEIFAFVNNNMPCIKDVQWEVNASNLVTSPTSGIGNTATLSALPNVKGFAIITYTLTSNGCDPAEVEKEFWIGSPQALTTYPDPTICQGQFEEIIIPESYGASSYHLQSLSPYLWISNNTPTPYAPIVIVGTQVGVFQLQLTVTNDCGSSRAIIFVEVERCRGDGGGFKAKNSSPKSVEPDYNISVYPNPAKDFIEVTCSGYIPGTRIAARIISTDGKVVRTLEEYSHNFKVGIGDLLSGLYVLELNVNGTIFHEKIVKL